MNLDAPSPSPSPSQPDPVAGSEESGRALRAAVGRQLGRVSEELFPPPAVPDHTLIQRVGRGSYGEVWLARSTLGTRRAVKVVYRARFEDGHPYEREFQGIVKYEPVSRTHEGLVQVLHVGRNDEAGCFYYVMELADEGEQGRSAAQENAGAHGPVESAGSPAPYTPRTLRSDLKQHRRLVPADAAQIALRLAGGLAHLHAHGLVHRDIKPSNVIFVNGQPKLADIGLVAGLDDSRSFVGTEGFIPPEGPGSARADIYSLGKLLYELATGRDRLEFPELPLLAPAASSVGSVAWSSRETNPAGARNTVAEHSKAEALLELNEVMTRACAPDPARRYASATEMQADLNLFLAGRGLRRARQFERSVARLKRFAVAACWFLLLAAVAVWFSQREERHAREREDAANSRARMEAESRAQESRLRERAEGAEQRARSQLHTALLEQARAVVRGGETGHRTKALDALSRAAAISNVVELRREVFAALALTDVRFVRELPFDESCTLRLPDPRFERIAVCRGAGPVEIRSMTNSELLATLPASTNRNAHIANWSPDGRYLAVQRALDGGSVWSNREVWDFSGTPRMVRLLKGVHRGAIDFHPDSRRLLTAIGRKITEWDVAMGVAVREFTMPGTPWRLCYSPDGGRFAMLDDDEGKWIVSIHDATNGTVLARGTIPRETHTFEWHPDGEWLAVPDYRGVVSAFNARDGTVREIGRHQVEAVQVRFTPDGDYLFSGGWEKEMICWDARTLRRLFVIRENGYIHHVRADGDLLAIQGDKRLGLYAIDRPTAVRDFGEPIGVRVRTAAFSPDGRWLAASAIEGMGVWDLLRRGPGAILPQSDRANLFFTPDSRELYSSRREAGIGAGLRWSLRPGAVDGGLPEVLPLPWNQPARFDSLSLHSNHLFVTTAAGSAWLPRPATGEPDSTLGVGFLDSAPGFNGLSPDGRWAAIYQSYGSRLDVHRLPGLERVARLTAAFRIGHFEFSPDGRELAVSSRAGVECWSTETWKQTRVLKGFMRLFYLPPPTGAVVLVTVDGAIGLYDARTLNLLLPFPAAMDFLASSADGRHIAASIERRRLQVWDMDELRGQLRALGMHWEE